MDTLTNRFDAMVRESVTSVDIVLILIKAIVSPFAIETQSRSLHPSGQIDSS